MTGRTIYEKIEKTKTQKAIGNTMEQEFLTGKCPKCMQELRVPASLAEFSCMYCGARLAQSDLVTEAAETPAAPDADAYAAALEELSGCIRNYRGFHKRVILYLRLLSFVLYCARFNES